MAILTPYFHVELNDDGVPMITGTTMKVIELVLDHIAYGWDVKELKFQHPYLTLGQIHSALAYYWDHQTELDADIKRRALWVEELERSQPEPPLVARLRGLKSK